MKKTILILGIVSLFIFMPMLTAKTFSTTIEVNPELKAPFEQDYDGTFLGGLGVVSRENEEWEFDTHAYLVGVYKEGNKVNRLLANIYDLDENQIGSIAAFFGHRIIIGFIQDMGEKRAPIIGFLFSNDEYFAGRIMSVFGPAPHIFGKFTPN